MTLKATMRALDEVAAYLPFSIDAFDEANAAFRRWREQGDRAALELVELWLYCYTRRYFLTKFLRDSSHGAADLDTCVSKAFTRARSRFDSVDHPDRFANWVSVVCKNVFINFLRRYRETNTFNEERTAAAPEEPLELDRLAVRRGVENAIARLPESLQEVARLRLLEGQSYEDIAEATGRSLPTLRVYASRAMGQLREDPQLRIFFEDLMS